MTNIYTQYEITKPADNGVRHRSGFMTPAILAEWLSDGWSVLQHWPATRLAMRRMQDGSLRLVEAEHVKARPNRKTEPNMMAGPGYRWEEE